jgi:hypothetical protein
VRKHIRPVLCPVYGCKVRTAEQREMARHVELEHDEARIFCCPFCNEKFRIRQYNLLRHIRRKHDADWSFRN